ncbi:MAG: T9SS type A sorting domain-containing protein [Candidatus Aegiribacteria sp.]|nr:T9SS type A sorting domain-containing protein [Candidatus Aegiribacteria sp.]
MKRSFFILLLAVAAVFASGVGDASSWQSFGGSAGEISEVTVLESDQNHMVLEISIPGFWLYDSPAEGRIWDCIDLPDFYSQGKIGLPDLPSVTKMFALPFGTEAIVTVEEVNSAVYGNMEILPRQTPEIDMDHEPYPFVIVDEFYRSNENYPSSWVNIDNEGIWSGLNVARLVVNPFSYNPYTGNLEAASSIILRVDFEGNATEFAYPVNPSMVPAMEQNVINWDVFKFAADPLDGSRDDGVEYVFVCTDTNVDWVSELIETHHYLGLHTRVETLTAPATSGAIKTAITDNYDTGVTRFACIVGTNAELPSHIWDGFTSDYWYACFIGSDNFPEIAVGRLTGNQTQIENQVAKIIGGYMDYDFDDTPTTGIIPSECILAAHGEQYPGKYTACMNELAAFSYSLINFDFTTVFPPEGGTAAMVSTGINNEIGTVTYRGHGSQTSWTWSPGWNNSNITALTNTFMPPVFNIACYCGDYTGGGTCLAEAWQWATHGSSGNLAATDPSYTEANHVYIKQIYKEIFDTGLFRIGEGINAATVYTINNQGSIGISNAKMYIWFGDPAMDIWTFDTASEPGVLEISPPASIPPGNSNVTVTVTDDGSAVAGANVTLTDGVDNYGTGMTFYEEGTTNSFGEVTINITAPSSGTVHIGAFLHDYNYDIAEVIIGTGVAASEGASSILSLDSPYPNPIMENASLGFSVPVSGRVELAVYDLSGRMVETILDGAVESGSHSMTWAPGAEIASGVYFVRLSTEGGTLTRQAMIIR